jgi:hypothetical protein
MEEIHSAEFLVETRPSWLYRVSLASWYLIPPLFWGPLAVYFLTWFGLRPNHPVYFLVYGIAAVIPLVFVRREVQRRLDLCHFTLTRKSLTIGKKLPVSIDIADIQEMLPIYFEYRSLQRPLTEIRKIDSGFHVLLIRLSDQSLLPLAPINLVYGFDNLLTHLSKIDPALTQIPRSLTTEEMEAVLPKNRNMLHPYPQSA